MKDWGKQKFNENKFYQVIILWRKAKAKLKGPMKPEEEEEENYSEAYGEKLLEIKRCFVNYIPIYINKVKTEMYSL
jgi:hypothetical protein